MGGMTTTQILVDNFFAREDLEFVNCPVCTRPLLKQACEARQRRRGHWDIRENEEVEVVSDFFRFCEGCQHFQPDAPKEGKLTKHERLERYGVGRDEARRQKRREEIKAAKMAGNDKFAWRKTTTTKWAVK